ncbi:MAG: 4Fe-4S binding protein [Candidatus Hodarchaeota archaeon]
MNSKSNKEKSLPTFNNKDELPHIPVSIGIKGSIGKTGEWRTFRPVIDGEKCNKCGFCYIFCPEGTIRFDKETGPTVDLVYCKGCGICAAECPKDAIEMTRETAIEEE